MFYLQMVVHAQHYSAKKKLFNKR